MSRDWVSDAPKERMRTGMLTPEQATEQAKEIDQRAKKNKARGAVKIDKKMRAELPPWMNDPTLLPKAPPGRSAL